MSSHLREVKICDSMCRTCGAVLVILWGLLPSAGFAENKQNISHYDSTGVSLAFV